MPLGKFRWCPQQPLPPFYYKTAGRRKTMGDILQGVDMELLREETKKRGVEKTVPSHALGGKVESLIRPPSQK